MVNSSRRLRPPGRSGGVTTTTKAIWAWTLLALHAASAQAGSLDYLTARLGGGSLSTQEAPTASRRTFPGRSPREAPHYDNDNNLPTGRHKSTERYYVNDNDYQNALAPAHHPSAVEAPSAQSPEALGSPALPARLTDWEATDIILVSTIDGVLHARDRMNGQHRWSLDIKEPMIEAVQISPQSTGEEGVQPASEYKFFVEPSPGGQLYALFSDPEIGLVKSFKTVKQMAAEVPLRMDMSGYSFMITSLQRSASYTVDALSGEILNQFPRQRHWQGSDLQPRCKRRNELETEDPACSPGRILRLGRSTYEFTVSDEATGLAVYTIKFSEWVPYVNERNLQKQYRTSFDGLEIQTLYNGRFMCIDLNQEYLKPQYNQVMNTTVARIYDVLRPVENNDESSELIVLSRPTDLPVPPQHEAWKEELFKIRQSGQVFLNKTADGTWYAMSDASYPGVTSGAPRAEVMRLSPGRSVDLNGNMNDVVGVHILASPLFGRRAREELLTIGSANDDSSALDAPGQHEIEGFETASPPLKILPSPPAVSTSVVIPYTLLLAVLIFYAVTQSDSLKNIIQKYLKLKSGGTTALLDRSLVDAASPSNLDHAQVQVQTQDQNTTETSEALEPSFDNTNYTGEALSPSRNGGQSSGSAPLSPRKKGNPSEQEEEESDAETDDDDSQENAVAQANGVKPRKKTKRGKRGGRKNKKKSMDPATFDEKPVLALEQPLDAGMLQVGTLRIDTREEKCLGRGSNGTTVYPGLFNGREVAVKRLIKSTNDLAKKEIKHLMSSDENPHVVRFHTHEESRDFFYIALDRFTTSLDQFIEHPDMFPSLISGTKGFDVKDCLRQITYGVQHLHSLKLVHRDIKPQNVLVKGIKTNRPTPEMPPLLFVISDFGLCKPLEEGAMSTFAPTANHTAAGTTGWRAPELLVGPRDLVAAPSAESTQSVSTNHSRDGTVIDPPTGRRATKAIDIFSLGCVFYYVMTQGGHPFDKGGSSLGRDLNIKENNFTTELLQLHRYEYDADDLVLQMVMHEPGVRPDCARVLRHPYFWSQEQKLDFLCLVSDSYEGEKNSINNIHDEHAIRTPVELEALDELAGLESLACNVIGVRGDGSIRDFLTALPKSFLTEMGKQRKYTGTKMIDLLRVVRNKKNHFKDLPPEIRNMMMKHADGQLAGYYQFWAERFPSLLINCHAVVVERNLIHRFGLEKWYE